MGRGVLQRAAARLGGRLGSRGERATAKGRVEVEAVIAVERDQAAKCLDVSIKRFSLLSALLKAVGSPQGWELASPEIFSLYPGLPLAATGNIHAKLQRA